MVKKLCPYCNRIQKDHWVMSSWNYGSIKVTRFECECGKNFNFYQSANKNWTIPKSIKNEHSNLKN